MGKEKFQMTEEQARSFYSQNLEVFSTSQDGFISVIRSNGHIRKSELQILVEEAEKMWDDYCENKSAWGPDVRIRFEKYYEIIQALKKDHPELKPGE